MRLTRNRKRRLGVLREIGVVAAAVSLVMLTPAIASASSGPAYTSNYSGSSLFTDTLSGGTMLESFDIFDDAPDGYGVRAQIWLPNWLYNTYHLTTGNGTAMHNLVDANEGLPVVIQLCNRDKLSSGTIYIFNCGSRTTYTA